jgi:hypothetical protein
VEISICPACTGHAESEEVNERDSVEEKAPEMVTTTAPRI